MTCNSDVADRLRVLRSGMEKKINLRAYEDESVSDCLSIVSVMWPSDPTQWETPSEQQSTNGAYCIGIKPHP